MTVTIGRRELLATLGGAAAWPLAARAQQPAMPVIGFISGGTSGRLTHLVAAFVQGLKETGHVEGQNVAIEYRWADGDYHRLPGLAADLVGRRAAAIVASGPQAAQAAKSATTTVPIVFVVTIDPVAGGLVTSLSRPGGNITGVTFMAHALAAKRLELLHELVPDAAVITMLVNPNSPTVEADAKQVQESAHSLGLRFEVVNASTEEELATVFARVGRQRPGALFVNGDPLFFSRRDQLGTLAARHAVATSYDRRDFVAAGGLMSYGAADFADAYREAGTYAGRILGGAKPADLPVMQSTKFALVINLKTAKALGLTIPDKLLALADEVIE
jgi:putative tryptophan/tyrosine transport system substrate-binding protein